VNRALALGLMAAVVPATVAAQAASTVARTGVSFESYSFGDGLAFKRISELTIPVTLTQRVGNRLVLDLGTAFASAAVDAAGGGTIDHSGLIDTDLRATLSVIPGKLIFNFVGTIPTGATTVPDTTIPLFGATATDLLAFTTPGFGAGGGASAGVATAFRLGSSWAIGVGTSYRYGARYTPVRGGDALTPGGEIRGRFGIEGPFGGGKYFRGALVYTTTGANDIGAGGRSAIGDRVLVYGSASMPLGRSNLVVYGWDMRRLRARDYDAPGTISVPRGNVLALGARLERPLSPRATVVPLVEFRHELTGPTSRMELLGYLLRSGADLRYQLSSRATGVLQAQLAFGALQNAGSSIAVVGPRLGFLVEWSR
jgi:hypothetical protein